MKLITRKILEQVIADTAEPLAVVSVDRSDWPVLLANPAFARIADREVHRKPFIDVIEGLAGRELAIEVSEALRLRQESSFPIESGGSDYLLVLKPLHLAGDDAARFYSVYWRHAATSGAAVSVEMHQALLTAKRRLRDLSRDDPVSGLLNGQAFREVFEHDWAVAARDRSTLSLVLFSVEDFDAYVDVFGRHAADSCLRRCGHAIRRCLRRASDVVARPGDALFVVLSHGSEEPGVHEFAGRIAAAIRELGLHHPRSAAARFVTVSFQVSVVDVSDAMGSATDFLESLPGWQCG